MEYLAALKSELKLSILGSLLGGEKRLSEICSEVKSSETTILHVLKEFEELNLTSKSSGIHKLTPLGVLEAQICKNATLNAQVVERFKDFWLSHDLSAFPQNLIIRIGSLLESTLIKSEDLELGIVYTKFLEMLNESSKIVGISPIFHPNYVPVIENLLNQGKPVELILSSGVLAKTLECVNTVLAQKSFEAGILKIYLNDNLKVALTVTDKGFSLGLFKITGGYDDNTDLVSTSSEAIEWGQDLFLSYLKDSKRLELDNIK
jgi:predicted transcriptional regulator